MAETPRDLARNVNLFHECKNEIGTSRTYPNAPEGYRSPTDIAARILAYLRREGIGEAASGSVVVTVPASFQTAQRAETARACARAGLTPAAAVCWMNPSPPSSTLPTATMRAFLENVTGEKNLLVFDFGGGTCDIALFGLKRTGAKAPVQVASRSVSRSPPWRRRHRSGHPARGAGAATLPGKRPFRV